MNKIGQVISCAPDKIVVSVNDLKVFEENKQNLQVGDYLQIALGNIDYIIATIKNIQGVHSTITDGGEINWSFTIECQSVGTLIEGKSFERGGTSLPVPTEPVYTVNDETFLKLFTDKGLDFQLGLVAANKKVGFKIDGDKFFGKHIAIVGSTGSGKSYAVARILQDIVGISNKENKNIGKQNNSHIIIFDLHSEYSSAFTLDAAQGFTLNVLNVDKIKLPYWLMNSEELESMFIESREENSHNQVSQF